MHVTDSVVIYGNGQMAELASFYLSTDTGYTVAAFTVEASFLKGSMLAGIPVIAFDEVNSIHPPRTNMMFVALGYGGVNKERAARVRQAQQAGYSLISYVSSKSIISPGVALGENCFVMEGNIIQPYVRIGDDVTLGPGNRVGHHSTIGDHCFLASGADIAGQVTLEPYCFVGANATIRNDVRIGRESVIGAGTVIMKDTGERAVYASPRAVILPIPSDKLPRI
jgi:sugar O-acyltransferase (sialic acid O-acetyltransferase NeuD family)